ncbi:MAG: peptidoglycan editing factor PgeF [Rhodanobacteraceae bacterium]
MSEVPIEDHIWVFPDWPAPVGVRAVVTTRHGPGVSPPPLDRLNLGLNSGDTPANVSSNRRALEHVLKLPSAPRWLRQVHGRDVAELGPIAADEEPRVDAAVSHIRGTVLAILSADCLPVLFCSEDGKHIAAAHAGWRGLAAGVLEAVVQSLGVPGDRLLVWLGPCIAASSYEVDDTVRHAFMRSDVGVERAFVPTRSEHWSCDLECLARHQLQKAGVARIHGGGFDTFGDERFYSWRRDGAQSGRFASLVWLQPD